MLANAYEKLRDLSKKQSEYNKRLSTLVFSKGLMNLALEGRLIIEVQEWINKCSGKGNMYNVSFDESMV